MTPDQLSDATDSLRDFMAAGPSMRLAPAPSSATHELKTDPEVFDAVSSGRKTFEIRFDDRGYKEGDCLLLRRTKYSGADMKHGHFLIYTGETLFCHVTHILRGPIYGLQDGWVIMSLNNVLNNPRCDNQPDTTP